ncbi:MAG: SDR family oxidoreductase [Parvularculaceae bacterium]|nr:SDR family oxidoreductase [Parvularculaceae bacterium]
MTKTLQGKTALVTGASRGIGRAVAERLARDGAFVIAHYNASKAEADSLVAAIRAAGGEAVAIGADLSDARAVERLAADVRTQLRARDGRLDILVNNAGVADFVPFAETTEAQFDRVFAVNVKAPFILTQKLIDAVPDGGRVIFTTTVVSDVYFAGVPAYAASKGAIDTLIRYLAGEYGAKGVRVTGVAPGAIDTDMGAWVRAEGGADIVKSIQALPRVGKPEDIAGVVAFLAGPDGAWVTGAIVAASGGTKL